MVSFLTSGRISLSPFPLRVTKRMESTSTSKPDEKEVSEAPPEEEVASSETATPNSKSSTVQNSESPVTPTGRLAEQSDDEFITDSSEDSILEEQRERETMAKEQEAPPVVVLPTPVNKKESFVLNGMKVTLRKRPSHKVKKTDRCHSLFEQTDTMLS